MRAMRLGDEIIDWLEGYRGLREIPGPEHEPVILEIARILGLPHILTDEQNWCGVIAGFTVSAVGCRPPENFTIASNWRTFGAPVLRWERRSGDIVVIKGPDVTNFLGWHVGFFTREIGNEVFLLGGNQLNQIKEHSYPVDRIDTFRRAMRTA